MKVEDFTLDLQGDSVPWRLYSPENQSSNYCVLWLQGWTSSMESHREGVVRMATQTGITFATLDYAGHGQHELPLDESTRKQQHEEVVGVFDELTKRGYNNIIVIGGSFGGYMAALLTGKRPVRAAVLRAPAIYDDDEFDMSYKLTRRWQNPDAYQHEKATEPYIQDNAAVRAVHNFDGLTYIMEHELDEQVPQIMPRTYFEQAKHGNYLIIPKTMHSPKLMPNPKPHFEYIEHFIVAILQAIQLQDKL